MEDFNTQTGSLVSLTRALFGDFDIDAILDDSKDYLNAVLFLVYLFVGERSYIGYEHTHVI